MATIINNTAYSWSMIQLTSEALTGGSSTILNGVSGIKWNIKQTVETNYGLGGEPISRGFGNTVYSASITMDYSTQEQLRGALGSLRDLGEFNLIISYTNSPTEKAETVELQGCIFTEDGMEISQNDTNVTHEFDLSPFKIMVRRV